MENKFAKSIKNIVIGFGGQLVLFALGIIVPRLILVNYGSEVNGLTNTVNQIYNYVALLEAGIGQSALFALYKAKNNRERSDIVSATVYEYRKYGIIYILCVAVLSTTLPLMLRSELPYFTIFFITLFAGLPSLINFFTTAAYIQLLTVEGKHYVESVVNLLVTSFGYIARIVLANLRVNIVFLFVAYTIISLLKTFFFLYFIKKNYPWINKKPIQNRSYFSDRKGYISTQIAWIVFSNTDVILISLFCGLKSSSVYAVYGLVFNSIYTLMSQIYAGVNFLLGHEYNESIEKYTKLHDAFDCFFDMLVCSTMAICMVLTIPFVKLYTAGITDIEYIDPMLPLLFSVVQILTWVRYASGNLTSLAGYANKIGKISIIEATINILLTIVFVQLWGIRGALLATVVALLFKSNYLLVFVNKRIMKRRVLNSYKICFTNVIPFCIVVFIRDIIPLSINNYLDFVIAGIMASLIIYASFYLINLIINKEHTLYYSRIILNKIKHNRVSK